MKSNVQYCSHINIVLCLFIYKNINAEMLYFSDLSGLHCTYVHESRFRDLPAAVVRMLLMLDGKALSTLCWMKEKVGTDCLKLT